MGEGRAADGRKRVKDGWWRNSVLAGCMFYPYRGKESVAQAWERLPATLGEGYGASPYFVSQRKTGKTGNHLPQVLGDIYWGREDILSSKFTAGKKTRTKKITCSE